MKTKENKILKAIVFSILAIFGLFSFALILPKNSAQAQEIEKPDISQASVNDDYFCLKDYYRIETSNQDGFGTCSYFSYVKSFETFLQRKTGEKYDFSEAWLTLCMKNSNSSYVIGNGVQPYDITSVIARQGLLLESEFPYDNLYALDSTNYEQVYEMYATLAHKYNFDKYKFTKLYDSSLSQEENIKRYKQHLLTNGGISSSINDTEFIYINNYAYSYSEKTLNHAITVIGWNDNVSFKDKNNITRNGAFIALNSWGELNSIVLVAYDDPNLLTHMYGFEYNLNVKDTIDTNDFEIVNSNSNVTNYVNPSCNDKVNSLGKSIFLDQNIFNYGDNISITYEYTNKENIQNISFNTKILNNNVDVSSLFNITSLNNKVTISSKSPIDSGDYIVLFEVDKNNDGVVDKTCKHEFFVYSQAEFCYVRAGKNTSVETYQMFNKVLSIENKNTIYAFSKNSSVISLCFNDYARVKSVQCFDDLIISNGLEYKYRDYSEYSQYFPYSNGRFDVELPNYSENKLYTFNLYIYTYDNTIIQVEIKWYNLSSNDKRVYVYQNPSDNYNTNINDKYIAVGENFSQLNLSNKSSDWKNNYYYYWDKSQTQYVDDQNFDSFIKSSLCDNYNAKNNLKLYTDYEMNYTFIYPMVTNQLMFCYEDVDLGSKFQYAEQMNVKIPQPVNVSNYSLSIINDNFPQGVSCDPYTFCLVGTPKQTGNFSFDVSCVDKYNNDLKTIHVTFTVRKKYVVYTVDYKSSEYGEELVPLTYNVLFDEIDKDDANIKLSSQADKFTIGNYEISGEVQNDNYIGIYKYFFSKPYYKVAPRTIKYNLSGYSEQYDGNEHGVSLQITSAFDCTVEYSLDNNNFSTSEIKFKNYTPKTKIYVKISAENSTTINTSEYVEILKRKLTINNLENQFFYDGKTHAPKFNLGNVVEGDDVGLTVGEGAKEIGDYVVPLSVSNQNYEIDEQISLKIKKAIPQYKKQLKVKVDNSIKWLRDIELPQGYEFVNSNQSLEFNKKYAGIYVPTDTEHYEIMNVEIIVEYNHGKLAGIIFLISISIIIPCVVVILVKAKKRAKGINKQ